MPHVLFYVQHLLGLGHDQRAAAITRALVDAGIDVTYVTGGLTSGELDLAGSQSVALPPLKARDPDYSGLVGPDDRPPDANYWASRRRILMKTFRSSSPDLLLIEMFPFGRWPFRDELLQLLESAHGTSAIACSIRDILEPKMEHHRNQQIVDLIEQFFDAVLVHGDAQFIPLGHTFDLFEKLSNKIHYTGYVCAGSTVIESGQQDGTDEIVVSAGGGATCGPLMLAAASAAACDTRTWRLLIGPNCPPAIRAELHGSANVIVEDVRPDFTNILSKAAASISQAGYNTTMDILSCSVPAVLVPYQTPSQSEQWRRASRLAEYGRISLLPETDLSAKALLRAVEQAKRCDIRETHAIKQDGAKNTADTISQILASGISTSKPI